MALLVFKTWGTYIADVYDVQPMGAVTCIWLILVFFKTTVLKD